MIRRVIDLMQPQKTDRMLDLFCGLGNFTLPLARYSARVTGVEGATRLVEKARANAVNNAIDNADFQKADLYLPVIQGEFLHHRFDKVLMDPPRSGAKEVIEQMDFSHVHRLVYVSCNPATLARDAGLLVKQHGFSLNSAGVMDMFPHTTHVESLAVFDKT
jgi:23S rRNA (uracil1939-C5)-methyltransferase